MSCPALGPSPTVTCPLRELLKTKKIVDKERPAVDGADVPDFADKICAQHSVSFEVAKMRRQEQAFEYGTREWQEFHTHARNSIESANAQLKSGGTEQIEDANRRRVRGYSAAQIIVTILITNFNLRKISAFLSDRMKEEVKQRLLTGVVVKRRRKRDEEWANAYTKTYGGGAGNPTRRQKQVATNNETGGPPIPQ